MLNMGLVILGVDPGLRVTGYGVIEATQAGPRVCEAGVIRPVLKGRQIDLPDRLRLLYESLIELIEQFHPSVLAVEQLYSHYKHPRTAILMGHARGVLLLAGAKSGITIRSYSSTTIKKTITGSGRAPKLQVQHAVQRELRMTKLPEPPDVADALAVALCEYHCRDRSSLSQSPLSRKRPASKSVTEISDD